MLDEHEKDPETYEVPLKKKLTEAGVDKDEEIIKKAEDIMKKEDPQGTTAGNYNMNIGRDFKGVAIQEMNDGTINQRIS